MKNANFTSIFFIIFLITACGGGGGSDAGSVSDSNNDSGDPVLQNSPDLSNNSFLRVSSIALAPVTDTLAVGERSWLSASVLASGVRNTNGRGVVWSSSNESVATVKNGEVKAIAPGVTTITGTNGGMSASSVITIIEDVVAVEPKFSILNGGKVCALAKTGRIYCWGGSGGVGNAYSLAANQQFSPGSWGVKYRALTPVAIGGGLFKDIVQGRANELCALDLQGRAWCWLGDGELTGMNKPALIGGDHSFISLFGGGDNYFGITENGTVYWWGYGYKSSTEQEGYSPPTLFGDSIEIFNGHKFVSIEWIDYSEAMGIKTDGSTWNLALKLIKPIDKNRVSSSVFMVSGGFINTEAVSRYKFKKKTAPRAGGDTSVVQFGLTEEGNLMAWGGCNLRYATPWQEELAPQLVLSGIKDISGVVGGHYYVDSGVSVVLAAVTVNGELYLISPPTAECGRPTANKITAPAMTAPIVIGSPVRAAVGVGLAIGVDGHVISFGANGYGELGRGTYDSNETKLYSPSFENPDFIIQTGPTIEVSAGLDSSISYPFLVQVMRTGSLNVNDPVARKSHIDLSVTGLPAGIKAELSPRTLTPGQTTTSLVITADASMAACTATATITGNSGAKSRSITLPIVVNDGVNSCGGGSSDGDDMSLVCPSANTSLPNGYQCLDSGTALTPGKYAVPQIQGTWVEQTIGLCITYNANGTASGRYAPAKLGGGGATVTSIGKWGILVKKNGTPEGTATQWYVFTAPLDAQTRLMGFDSSKNAFSGGNFLKGSCPW